MPVEFGRDSKGKFARWGKHGKKYRYCKRVMSRWRAKELAARQGRAIKVSQARRKVVNHPKLFGLK